MIGRLSAQERAKEWRSQTRLMLAFERGLTSKLRREFNRTAREAADEVEAHGHPDVHAIQARHERRLKEIIAPTVKAAYKVFAKRVLAAAPRKAMTEDEINEYADEFTKKWVPRRVQDISKTTASKISDSINKGREQELTDREVAKMIVQRTGGRIGASRAATIARTESHGAAMAGSTESAKQLGIHLVKVWTTVGDDRVRDDHFMTDGDEAEMDEDFNVGQDQLEFPGDPNGSPEEVINCRCVLTYKPA